MRLGQRRPRPLYAARYQPPARPAGDPKADFACCRNARDNDPLHRWPVGDCGPGCERKAWRKQQVTAGGTTTMGRTTARPNGGDRGDAPTPPGLADDPKEVIDNG